MARIALGRQRLLTPGNLEARRDGGFAGDSVDAMWRMLQQDEAEDYIVATSVEHAVRELVTIAFAAGGIDDWSEQVRQDDCARGCGADRAVEAAQRRPSIATLLLVARMTSSM